MTSPVIVVIHELTDTFVGFSIGLKLMEEVRNLKNPR
jgi:hypothetical protein